jgi:serine/threonine protein kinase
LLRSICSALTYLHSEGVAHGDVYGHNILANVDGSEVRLADFGAAYVYHGMDATATGLDPALLERLEVRAFGVLVAEIAARIVASVVGADGNGNMGVTKGGGDVAEEAGGGVVLKAPNALIGALEGIAAESTAPHVRRRPSFHELLVRFFLRQKFTLEDAIGSHACSV